MNNKNRAITYSLLTHIRNNGNIAKGPFDIFIPLLKKTISSLNNKGIYQGSNISEIKVEADKLYSLDFPIPVIKKILLQISKEINKTDKLNFVINKDDSFIIDKYIFDEFDDILSDREKEINRVEELYHEFLEITSKEEILPDNIFRFIEKNKFNLSKYFSENNEKNDDDFTNEAQFISFFKNIPYVYEVIKDIYLGAIISCYIEYQPCINTNDVELLLDTNFIVGLLDLNTPESTHTCRTLIKIAKANNYKISVLQATINETENLLKSKAYNFDKSFLQKRIYPEDVFNACDRRKLNKSDLERISDNIIKELNYYKVNVIYHHDNYTNEAKFSTEYEELKNIRNSNISALHDATAITYVKKQRKRKIKEFDKVNCWFVNNSTSFFGDSINLNNKYQSTTIKADDLLNVLWLSNPSMNKEITSDDIINIGLTSTISLTLNKNLPKSRVLKEFDENLCKYAQEDITDEDIVKIAKRITNKQLTDIEELNTLAENDKEKFIKRLNDEASKQKLIEKKTAQNLENFLKSVKNETSKYNNLRKKLEDENKAKSDKLIEIEKALKNKDDEFGQFKKDLFINKKIEKWRYSTIKECLISFLIFICICIYMLNLNDWSFYKTLQCYKNGSIFNILISVILILMNTFYFKSLYDKYRNHSNIENFKKNIKIPKDL